VRGRLLVEVGELGIAVEMLVSLDGLGVGLQAEPLSLEQLGDRVRADLVPGPGLSCIGLVTTLGEVVEDGLRPVRDAWWGGDLLGAEADGGAA
jgi:hypothetical protein